MAVRAAKRWSIDFLQLRPDSPGDALAVQLLEARNVVSSYSHAVDFLAEALQNATDAIDARRRRAPAEERAYIPARIDIHFDCKAREFSVTDTGIGMSEADLGLVLTPNVSLKSGAQARAGTARSRGHKGVGLSFLALASNNLQIRTCDGQWRYDVAVSGGEQWVTSSGKSAKPVAHAARAAADKMLGSETYTTVSVAQFDSEDLEDDLFELSLDALVWRLRTVTAVGNTKPVFNDIPRLGPDEDIEINLIYTPADGKALDPVPVPYRYATLEELVPAARRLDFPEVAKMSKGIELLGAVRGMGVRYSQDWTSKSGKDISVYCFAMDGRDVEQIRDEREADGLFFPQEWQGTFVATRQMPTRVQLDHDEIQPRAYRRRMLILLQDDQLELDVGRKTLTGSSTRMLRTIVKAAWDKHLQRVVSRLQPLGSNPDRELLDAIAGAALARKDLGAHIPYLKEPGESLGVLAVFHELVSHDNGYLPTMRTLKTGVRRAATDSLISVGDDPQPGPLHVLFAVTGPQLIKDLVREDGSAATADLAVVWSLRPKTLSKQGIDVVPAEPGPDGATHELRLYDFAGMTELRVVELTTVVKERG